MNNLTNKLIDCKAGCYIDMQCINYVLYADDICLMTATTTAMQCMLDISYNYGLDSDVLFNPLKSVCTLFKPKGYKLYRPNIMIGTEVLKYVDNPKYLGITFCETMKDDKDIIRQMRLLYAKSNKLLHTFSHCTTDLKLKLFDSYCTSLYCPFLWTNYTKRTFSKLSVAFNNNYRKIFNLSLWSSASTMYAENNICNFEAMLRKSIY